MRAYGETDFEAHRIKINKKMAKRDKELGITILHESIHAAHPNMKEKTVRKREKKFHSLSKKAKGKLYAKTRKKA